MTEETRRTHKLVRDKIPEIIAANGQTCEIEILSDRDFAKHLREKLAEECQEYQESAQAEELADLLEVIYALAAGHGLSPADLEELRRQKKEARGGFSDKILLKSVVKGPQQI